MSKIVVHKQDGYQTLYYTTMGNQRYTLIVNNDGTIDPKSLIPYVNMSYDNTKNKLKYTDIPKLLIENGHQDKCRIFNYLIMEYLNTK